jgi:hypothetical protein
MLKMSIIQKQGNYGEALVKNMMLTISLRIFMVALTSGGTYTLLGSQISINGVFIMTQLLIRFSIR